MIALLITLVMTCVCIVSGAVCGGICWLACKFIPYDHINQYATHVAFLVGAIVFALMAHGFYRDIRDSSIEIVHQ